MSYIVYWAHLKGQSDIYKDGYVGRTDKTLNERQNEHEYLADSGSNTTFHQAIRKHGKHSIIWVPKHEGLSETEARRTENHYRPAPGIGWNDNAGG